MKDTLPFGPLQYQHSIIIYLFIDCIHALVIHIFLRENICLFLYSGITLFIRQFQDVCICKIMSYVNLSLLFLFLYLSTNQSTYLSKYLINSLVIYSNHVSIHLLLRFCLCTISFFRYWLFTRLAIYLFLLFHRYRRFPIISKSLCYYLTQIYIFLIKLFFYIVYYYYYF